MSPPGLPVGEMPQPCAGPWGTVAVVTVQPMVAPPEPSLVGRDRDVERLAALVSGIARGSRVVVVRGEARAPGAAASGVTKR